MRTDSNDRPNTFHGVDVNAMLKIKTERGYGVSIGMTENLCVTVMVNRSTVKIDKRLSEAEALLFRNVKNAGDTRVAQ